MPALTHLPAAHLPLLEQAAASGGNALLLTGTPYSGAQALALGIFAARNCSGPRGMAGEACGECSSCRALAAGAHPDLLTIAPRELTSTGRAARRRVIPAAVTSQKRDTSGDYEQHVLEFTEVRPTYQRRAVLIQGAEYLSPEAANALLKLIEEPPHRAFFLLLAGDLRAVMPTIVSRSTRLNIPPLDDQAMYAALAQSSDQGEMSAETLVEFAAGRPELLTHAAEVAAALEDAAHLHATLQEGLLPALDAAAELEKGWDAWHAPALRFTWRSLSLHTRASLDTALDALEQALEAYANPSLSFMAFALAAREALGES